MNLDDQLRSAAADVRSGLGSATPPPFQPPSPGGSRLALVALVVAVIGGGWWLVRPSGETDPTIDAAVDTTVIAAPPAEEEPTSPQPPAAVSAGVVGFAPLTTSAMEQPSVAEYTIEPDTGVVIRQLIGNTEGGAVQPVFSGTQTYNADGSLLLVYRTRDAAAETGHLIVDASTGDIVAEPDFSGASDIENISWDGSDSDLLYFTSGSDLRVFDVETEDTTTVMACDDAAEAGLFEGGSNAGSASSGTGLIGLLCRQPDGRATWLTHDLLEGRTLISDEPVTIDAVPLPLVSGNGYVVVGEQGVLVLDQELALVRSIAIEASVFTVAQEADGSDVLVATVYGGPTDVGTVVVVDLTSGSTRVVVGPETGAPYPPQGTQLSTAATERPNLVAISTFSDESGPLANEIMLLELNGADTELRRLAHHRSFDNRDDDWPSTPMVAINPDGSRILFSSNWGTNEIATYEIALPA